jgi:hypothetical protein
VLIFLRASLGASCFRGINETAEVMKISPATVVGESTVIARAWLRAELTK